MLIIILAACGCVKNPFAKSPGEQLTAPKTIESTEVNDVDLLNACKNAIERYQGDDEESLNWIRKRCAYMRTEAFDRALMTYWQVNSAFPPVSTNLEAIKVLEDSGFIPFWPTDPITGHALTIVDDPAFVTAFSDIYVAQNKNGGFNYTLQQFGCSNPFSPYVDEFNSSELMNDLQAVVYPEGVPGGYKFPSEPADAFRDLVGLWFDYLIKEAFFDNNCQVPDDLEGLFAGRVQPNPNGWKHPSGPVADGAVGDFEFGVDPAANAYYLDYVSESKGLTQNAHKFRLSSIAGELVYDMSGQNGLTMQIPFDQLTQRMPLLTDELFLETLPGD